MKLVLPYIVILLLCAGCQQKEKSNQSDKKSCEEIIIEKDSIFGIIRNHAPEEKSLSVSIQNYVAALKTLDYTNCNQSFTDAFYRHIDAWESMIKVTDSYPNLRGEMHDVFNVLERTKDSVIFKTYLDVIWSTWSDVESQIKSE